MKDLATAFVKVLGNKAATKQVYNISGERYVTFDGIAKACALAAGAPEPELIHFDPKAVDLGKAKAFPLRDQHFFTSIEKVLPSRSPAPVDLKSSGNRVIGRDPADSSMD